MPEWTFLMSGRQIPGRAHDGTHPYHLGRRRWPRDQLSLSRLWYTVPPMKGGTTYGQYTVHRRAGPPHGVLGFHELDPRRVSAAGAALRGRVPRAYGGVAPRWATPDRPPVYRL